MARIMVSHTDRLSQLRHSYLQYIHQVIIKVNHFSPKAKVAFFAGCVVNYATPQLGLDVYDILAANNIQMVTYKKEACCGSVILSPRAKWQESW